MESKVCISEDYYYITYHNSDSKKTPPHPVHILGPEERISRCKDKLSTGSGPGANVPRARPPVLGGTQAQALARPSPDR